MIKAIMHGCNGKMGQVITALAKEDKELELVAGIDRFDDGKNSYPVYETLKDCPVEADVVIDFSTAAAVDALLSDCVKKKLPVVLCTTGLSGEQLQRVEEASRQTAVLKSANMSLGINLLLKLLKEAAAKLKSAGFDIEVVEKHHNQKVDAPSGTALALADAMNDALDKEYTYQYDRTKQRKKRDEKEIGIQAVRGGTIVGEHEVIFAGADEVVEFKHTAYSKAIFAKGAIQAAKFLSGKSAGMYDMSHVIGE